MAIHDSAQIKDTRVLLSQTPKNFDKDDYFLYELQQKVDADWRFRPNRCDIEREEEFGSEEYSPLEVVLQSVKNDKGEVISQDWARVVFKNIREKTQIGQRFRFSPDFDLDVAPEKKNVWLAMNHNDITPTSAQVICRCNGTIASIWTDEEGKNLLHYEPVVQTTKLNSAGFQYSEVAIDPRGNLAIIAQNNKYTQQYYINQRFVIGVNQIYKVTNILKSDARLTYDPESSGIVRLYLEMDQAGEKDDFVTRLAYNGVKEAPIVPEESGDYSLVINGLDSIPEILTTLTFDDPVVLKDGVPQTIVPEVTAELRGIYADRALLSDYVVIDHSDGHYTFSRIADELTLSCVITISAEIPNGDTLSQQIELRLFGF